MEGLRRTEAGLAKTGVGWQGENEKCFEKWVSSTNLPTTESVFPTPFVARRHEDCRFTDIIQVALAKDDDR
jgi:hypothetical protein